jgi:hypothetical protein
MSSATWHLERHRAEVRMDRLSALIDLARPGDGLVDLCVAGRRLPDVGVLGVAIPAQAPGGAELPVAGYVRGADLVTVYEESESRPVRLDALWRATGPEATDGVIAALDLVVSVRTSALQCQPELAVRSSMPCGQILRLRGAGSAEHEALTVPPDSPLGLGPAEGPGCLLFRPADGDLSYAEMVHPADFRQSRLCRAGPGGELVSVHHRLFPQPLEKGVILRARVRGAWMSRRDDVRLAAEQYGELTAAEPLLGA